MLTLKTTSTPAVRAILEGEAYLKRTWHTLEPDYFHLKDERDTVKIFRHGRNFSIENKPTQNVIREFEEAPDRFQVIERAEFVKAFAAAIKEITNGYPELD